MLKVILNPTDATDYKEKIWNKSLRSAFEDKLCTIADAESYYLLNTFANMALARKEDDMEFIHDAVMDLLQVIFFISTPTFSSIKYILWRNIRFALCKFVSERDLVDT